MIIRYELSQMCRTPLRLIAIFIALCVMTVMLSVSMGMYLACEAAMVRVDEEYTTIAYEINLSSPQNVLERETYALLYDQREKDRERMILYGNELQQPLLYTRHSMFGAYSSAVIPRLTARGVSGSFSYDTDSPNHMAILSVICEDVKDMPSVRGMQKADRSYIQIPRAACRMKVEEVVLAHEDVVVAETLIIQSGIRMAEDGSIPFREGERYLIWGVYHGGTSSFGTMQLIQDVDIRQDLPIVHRSEDGINLLGLPSRNEAEVPIIAALENMSVSDFQKTDAWTAWSSVRETVGICAHSLQIFSTDSVLIHESFLNRSAHLTDGRDFSAQELKDGTKVCVIHEELAARNGLSLGDTLDLTFYNMNFLETNGAYRYVEPHHFYTPQSAKAAQRENGSYTVVGIYSTGDQSESGVALHPNTVLVPQSALTIYNRSHPYEEYTVVLANGGEQAFREELASYGIGELFEYHDGGYSEIMPHLQAMADALRSIMWLCLGVWVLITTALTVLFVMMQKAHAAVKFRVGVAKCRIWGHTVLELAVMILPAVVLGSVVGYALYGQVLNGVMNSGFTVFYGAFGARDTVEILSEIYRLMAQTPQTFARLGGYQLAVLGCLSVLIGAWFTLRRRAYQM